MLRFGVLLICLVTWLTFGCKKPETSAIYQDQVNRSWSQESAVLQAPVSLDSSVIMKVKSLFPLFEALPKEFAFSSDLQLYPDPSNIEREWLRAKAVDSQLKLNFGLQGSRACEMFQDSTLRRSDLLCHTRLWRMRHDGDLYLMTFVVPETGADVYPTLHLIVVNQRGIYLGSILVSSASGDAGISSNTRAQLSGRSLFVETENSYDRSANDRPDEAPTDSTITYDIKRSWFTITDSCIVVSKLISVDSTTVSPFYLSFIEDEKRRKKLARESEKPMTDEQLNKLLDN